MKNKSGQLAAEPFKYIFMIVTIGFILIFGGYLIAKLFFFAKEVEMVKFNGELEREVASIYSYSPGSNTPIEIAVPKGIIGVCFAEGTNVDNIPYDDVAELVSSGIFTRPKGRFNVFYAAAEGVGLKEPAGKINYLKPENNFCVSTAGGVLRAELTNAGTYVAVAEIE